MLRGGGFAFVCWCAEQVRRRRAHVSSLPRARRRPRRAQLRRPRARAIRDRAGRPASHSATRSSGGAPRRTTRG
jgi:hypothetical protein